jgi:hypothetical protein
MKIFKNLFIFTIICSLSYALVTCNSREDVGINPDQNISKISSNLNNKAFGEFLIQSGVKDVQLDTQDNNIITFSFLTQKEIGFRKTFYNLSNYKFIIQNNKLYLGEYSIQKRGEEFIFFKNNSRIDIKSNKEYLNDFNLVILGIVYDELSKKAPIRYSEFVKFDANRVSGACAWWNTHTITGIG